MSDRSIDMLFERLSWKVSARKNVTEYVQYVIVTPCMSIFKHMQSIPMLDDINDPHTEKTDNICGEKSWQPNSWEKD